MNDEEFVGASLDLSWRLGTKTSFGVGAEVVDRTVLTVEDRLKRFNAGLSYRLSERLGVSLVFIHNAQEGNSLTLSDYKENQIHLFLAAEIF